MKKQKGAYTLEAVIVMSTIIFIIFAIISAFLLLYQNAVMYYVATQAAQEGAVMWTDTEHDLDGNIGGTDINQGKYYYRIEELFGGGGKEAKECEITKWAEQKLRQLMPGTVIGDGAEAVHVHFDEEPAKLFMRTVNVEITKKISIPFAEVAKFFNADLNLTVKAKASVAEPAEAIRNIDYSLELTKELWQVVSGKLQILFNKR